LSPFLAGITWLLLFQCAGEALARLTNMPVPGPVLGMILLFVALLVRPSFIALLASAADGLARHLSLLFVPAGVGVMLHLHRVASEWVPIVVALVVSTVLALAATAWTFQRLARRAEPAAAERST
jgi:holin-like protein